MNLEKLQQIKAELKRFSDTINEAILLAKNTPGWGDREYGKHDISGTRISGAVKRRALDLKWYLTKKL
jgi:hypothetical protein